MTNLVKYLKKESGIAPLLVFRIAFGLLMFVSIARFIAKGWVYSMYVMPKVYFPYYGFEWIRPLPAAGMYVVFGLLLLGALCIVLGLLYRAGAIVFFVLFTYVELLDKTNYLNHYYFVSLVSFLLIFLPAGKSFSLDNKLFKRSEIHTAPRAYIFILQLQMFVVYFFAGIAKLNADWLLEAQPLKTWLPAFSHYPVIGSYMEQDWVAYLFAWFSCAYDLSIGFLLFNRRTVKAAYVLVIVFHLATALFFNIGMFPFIMITITLIFFGDAFHTRIVEMLKSMTGYKTGATLRPAAAGFSRRLLPLFALYFLVQIVMPFRYLFYSGKLFWTEQGYRFSWRVMLMEKAGTALFTVRDEASGRQSMIDNKDYLTYMQEKMMATQPDMMVDYARFLEQEYLKKGYASPSVRVQSYVTVNGSGSRQFIDPATDLCRQSNSVFKNKQWVMSY